MNTMIGTTSVYGMLSIIALHYVTRCRRGIGSIRNIRRANHFESL